MKKNIYFQVQQHQLVFWLGVLAGAVIISLIFFYRILTPTEYKSTVLSPVKNTIQQTQKPVVLPKTKVPAVQQKSVLPQNSKTVNSAAAKSFPTPQGGKSAFPTPQGG